jgi:hypothetical protein
MSTGIEVEPPAVPDLLSGTEIVRSEIDVAREDSLKTLDHPTVVGAILRQVEFVEDLARRIMSLCRRVRVAIQSGISRCCPNGSP